MSPDWSYLKTSNFLQFRFGFPNPVNYNDNELYCGGFSVQWDENKGKCGVCGDRFDEPIPRSHEGGGKYGNGIIGRRYSMGQTIDIEIDISANHWGHFELKLCPINGKNTIATQECFDKHPLVLANNVRSHKFYVPLDSPKITVFNYKVNLPIGVTCSQCVMQWTYYTGNTWGVCSNGTEGMGCGYQETFRNCADVQINSLVGAFPPSVLPTLPVIYPTFYNLQSQQQTGLSINPLVVTARVCLATPAYASITGMDDFCQKNCLSYPPNCPEDRCYCLSHCEATGRLAGQEGTDVFCHRNCLRYPPHCPEDSCKCFKANSPARIVSQVPASFFVQQING
ncbi:uncharacterized protein LOC111713764 [Eurytemora carolleeae]|uniref:uncharacterized protein LOC111713764 n=1 Tax=Eurytemora carolleeae TaxID=1294199 RepID=UPI000C75E48F|nr:uncharacterized protein LOC111713764 [Eurytemora carolleeae]|eukprot:XP_023344479.1 uncharacterized protein LOC111713764 [Eurytemora affinis]